MASDLQLVLQGTCSDPKRSYRNIDAEKKQHLGVSENRLNPIVPNGFADHYPYEKWLFHWEYTLFSDKLIWKVDGENCHII